MSIEVILHLNLKDRQAYDEVMQAMADPETGLSFTARQTKCKRVDMLVNRAENKICMTETWDSQESYQAYLAVREEMGLMEFLNPLLSQPPEFLFFDSVDIDDLMSKKAA